MSRSSLGVRGLLKTADIEVNCALGLARPCSPFGGPLAGILGSLLGSILDTFSALFFFGASGTLKRGSGRAFKTRQFFLSILVFAWRASGGFPSRRQLNFNFCSRTQKGLQKGSQNGAVWAPKSQLYSLWGTIGQKSGPKKLHRKMSAESGGRGDAASISNWALDPLKDNARHPEPLQIRIKIEH